MPFSSRLFDHRIELSWMTNCALVRVIVSTRIWTAKSPKRLISTLSSRRFTHALAVDCP